MRGFKCYAIGFAFSLMMTCGPVEGYNLNYNYTNLDGQIISFSTYEGTFLFVEAFQSWCGHCHKQHPILGELDEYYSNTILNMLSISIDPEDTIDKLQTFVQEYPTTWDIGRDSSHIFASGEGVSGTPTMFLYDGHGNKLYKWDRETSLSELKTVIDYYLALTDSSDSSIPSYTYSGDGDSGSVIGDLFGSPIFQAIFFSGIIFMLYFKVTGGKPV